VGNCGKFLITIKTRKGLLLLIYSFKYVKFKNGLEKVSSVLKYLDQIIRLTLDARSRPENLLTKKIKILEISCLKIIKQLTSIAIQKTVKKNL